MVVGERGTSPGYQFRKGSKTIPHLHTICASTMRAALHQVHGHSATATLRAKARWGRAWSSGGGSSSTARDCFRAPSMGKTPLPATARTVSSPWTLPQGLPKALTQFVTSLQLYITCYL